MNSLPMLETIELYRGATAKIEFDLTDVPDGKIVFSMKQPGITNPIFQKELEVNKNVTMTIPKEFTASLQPNRRYSYDIFWVFNNEWYPQCCLSPIQVNDTIGGYRNE